MEEIECSEYLEELERQIDKKNNLIKEKSFFNKRNILASYLIDRGFEAQLVWNSINRRYK
jgi:regulatory protein